MSLDPILYNVVTLAGKRKYPSKSVSFPGGKSEPCLQPDLLKLLLPLPLSLPTQKLTESHEAREGRPEREAPHTSPLRLWVQRTYKEIQPKAETTSAFEGHQSAGPKSLGGSKYWSYRVREYIKSITWLILALKGRRDLAHTISNLKLTIP